VGEVLKLGLWGMMSFRGPVRHECRGCEKIDSVAVAWTATDTCNGTSCL
jgi:hypothetical protein